MQHGKFSSKLEVFYTEIQSLLAEKPVELEKFKEQFESLLDYVAKNAHKSGLNGDEDAPLALLSKNAIVKNSKSQLYMSYSRMISMYKRISVQEDRLSKFDFKERVRFLLFRICTAIGIAAVILGTAIVAKELGVSLPLSSLKAG